jgi:hypothetical protein
MADQEALHAFDKWVVGCSGNKKQEGQTFVQKLLTAQWRGDDTAAGVRYEQKILKGGAGSGTALWDVLNPHKGVIETKQCGEELDHHFSQVPLMERETEEPLGACRA